MLKLKYPHERDLRIVFIEEGHKYIINQEEGYTSVTTYIHKLFPTFNPDAVIEGMMKSHKWNQSPYYGMTAEEIKKQWADKGSSASKEGTKLHQDIEKWYNEEPVDNTSIEFAYFLNFTDVFPLTPYRTEWMVFDEDRKLCGSIDMTFINEDGSLDIYDWKRVHKIEKNSKWNQYAIHPDWEHLPHTNFWHYTCQLNLYRTILERKYNKVIRGMYLVVLHPSNSQFQRWTLPRIEIE